MSRVGQYQGSTEKYNLGWILPITGWYMQKIQPPVQPFKTVVKASVLAVN